MEKEIRLFGFSISALPRWLILLIGSVGILVSFLVQGTSQEALYTKTPFKETIFFTFIQFLGYFLFSSSYIVRLIQKKEELHVSIKYYILTSFCLCCSMGLSNLSVERLSYPTAVLFKSSKLIPVMIGGMIFLKKKYSFLEVLSVGLIVSGLVGVSYSDKISKNKFDFFGIFLSVTSLVFDAVASNLQEKALDTFGASQSEVISMMYMIGSVFMFFSSLFSGQLVKGIKVCIEYPQTIFYLASFAFLGSIGVQFVYLIMKAFGSLVTVMVTSTRKAVTVCLSFIMFPNKKFTFYHLMSILTIGFGLALNYIGKKKKVSNINLNVNEKDDENHPFLSKRATGLIVVPKQLNEEIGSVMKQTSVKGV